MRLVRHGLVAVACLSLAAVAYAQSTAVAVPDTAPVEVAPLNDKPATWGDAAAGQTLAGTCAACHGLDGNAMLSGAPRISGMPERYMAQQLAMFKNGQRNDAMSVVMMPFASMLSPQDMRDVGAWYASQKAGAGIADDALITEGPYKGMKFYEVGQKLYRAGDSTRDIPACMACHGPSGAGNPGPAYPALHGQDAAYAARRLVEFRVGTTSATGTDAAQFHLMASVAKNLTDEEIQSLGSYVQGLHARPTGTSASASGH